MTSNDDPNRIEKQAHRYAGYEAHDQKGEPVGEVDDLFVDTANGQEYVELNMGVLGLRSTVVPLEICEVDDERMIVAIPQSRSKLRRAPRKRAPLLGDEIMAITPEYEDRIRAYFGLEPLGPATEERPFRAFSTAYPSGDETPRGEVRPVEARRLDQETVEPEAAQPQTADETVPEPEATKPRVVQPYKIEAQDTGSVEPEVVVPAQDAGSVEPEAATKQDVEAAGSEVAEPHEATEPEAIDLAAAEDDAVEVRTVEPDVVEVRTVEPEILEPEDARMDETPDAAVSAGEPGSGEGETSDAEALPEEAEAPEPVYASSDADEQEASQPAAEETPQVPVTTGSQGVEAAGQQMTEAARRSFQALTDRAVKAQQSSLDLSGSIAQSFVQQLRSQAQGNRQATESLQQQGQRQQQALQTIVQGSVNAYANLFASTFSLYQQALQTAARVALGNVQAASRFAQKGTAVAAGSQSGAMEATRESVEAVSQAAAQEGPAEVAQGEPSRGSSAEASPARTSEQEGPEETTATAQANVSGSMQDVETVEGAVGENAGGSEPVEEQSPPQAEPVGESAVGQGGPDGGIDEAAPAGATPSEPLLPPPPVVPNILDELPPAPQVPSVDETLSEEEPKGRE